MYHPEQDENLDRVRRKIAGSVLAFRDKWGCERPFHCDDLRDFVTADIHVAPASPDRILRDLRQRGRLDYVVINRRESLYLFCDKQDPVQPAPDPQPSLFDDDLDEVWDRKMGMRDRL
jgi:hypothetical protein